MPSAISYAANAAMAELFAFAELLRGQSGRLAAFGYHCFQLRDSAASMARAAKIKGNGSKF